MTMSFFIWLLLLIHEAAILIGKGNSTAAQKVPRGAGCVRAFAPVRRFESGFEAD